MTAVSATTREHTRGFKFRLRWILYALMSLIGGGIFIFATLKPIRVLPRIRLAPGFALTDQNGNVLTSEDLRTSIVLYSFLYTRCKGPTCDSVKSTLLGVDRGLNEVNLGDIPFRFVVISFDPEYDTPARLRAFAKEWGVDQKRWTFVTGEPTLLKYIIGGGFESLLQKDRKMERSYSTRFSPWYTRASFEVSIAIRRSSPTPKGLCATLAYWQKKFRKARGLLKPLMKRPTCSCATLNKCASRKGRAVSRDTNPGRKNGEAGLFLEQ